MGWILFSIVLGIVSEVLWFNFFRKGSKQFSKYDKDHSTVTVINAEEVVAKLKKNVNLGISDIQSEENQINFLCQNNHYTINVENGTAYVEYDVWALLGRKRLRFWKSARKAMQMNAIMDALQTDGLSEQKAYDKIKLYAKAHVASFVAFVIFLVIGFSSFLGVTHNDAIADAKMLEYRKGVTYDELIEEYVRGVEWTAFSSEKDMVVVEVNGTSVEGEKVCIQFWGDLGMGLDYRTLTLECVELDDVPMVPDDIMEYIYLYYYLDN